MRSHINRYPWQAQTHCRYVDATAGADTNTGQADKPLKTVAAVNALVQHPGDRVLFKRGETFEDLTLMGGGTAGASGKPGRPVYYGAYGSGAAPIINGTTKTRTYDSNYANYVTLEGIHFRYATGRVMKIEASRVSILGCTVEGDIAQLAMGIELDDSTKAVDWIVIHDCTIYNNKVIAGGGAGIILSSAGAVGMSNVFIERNTIRNNGTSATLDHGIYVARGNGVTIRGNQCYSNSSYGIQLNGTMTNCLIEGNACYTNGSGGIRLDNTPAAGNNTVRNNLIYSNVKTGIQVGAASYQANVYHNTIVCNATTPAAYGVHVLNGTLGFVFKNNVIIQDVNVTADEFTYPIRVSHADVLTAAGNVFNYNLFFYKDRSAPRMGDVAGTGKNLAQWQAMTGTPDLNSQYADAVFVADYTDFHLQVTSPAIAASDPAVGVLVDYDGVVRGAAVDAGAYEYI